MRSSSTRRSSSVARPRSAAGKRSTTPSSRRQSDVQERPAWDASSNNLDKYKLTTEELERRKAARISKNRVLSSDAKSSFVQAWAKNVATSVMSGDADPLDDQDPDNPTPQQPTDQDRRGQGRTSPSPVLPIDYSSALQLLRKSPGGLGSGQRPSSTPPISDTQGGRAGRDPASAETSTGGTSGEAPDLEATLAHATGTRAAAERSLPGGGAREAWGSSAPGASPIGSGGDAGPGASAGGPGSGVGEGRKAEQQQQGAELRRAELSITPVTAAAASRPRFNAAEATTIISYEDGSDGDGDGRVSEVREGDDEEEEGSEEQEGQEDSASAGSPSPAKVLRPHARSAAAGAQAAASRRATEAAATAAFEAALFGRAVHGHGGKLNRGGGGLPAWSAEPEASPARLGAATGDVELRLRALEAAVGRAGAGGAAAEEVAELRGALRRVQEDNARLRQDMSAFSSHASSLMTQLQAQVNQLLRSTPSQHGPNVLAAVTSSAAAAAAQAPASAAAPAPGPQFSARPFQPLPDPHQLAPAPHPHGGQPSVSRRIFSDLDEPVPTARSVPGAWLAPAASPWGGGGPAAGQGGPQAPAVNVPSWLAGSDGGVRVGMGMGTGPVGAAMSVTAAPQPPPGLAVPVSMVDDVDVALPSFAAFRRSAGTSAFTAARPTPGLDHSTAPSPSPSTTLDPAHPYTFTAAPSRISPATAVLGTTTNPAPHLGPQLQHPSSSVLHQRAFPTQYQPRSLGGVLTQAGVGGGGNNVVLVPGMSSSAAAAAAAAASSLRLTSSTSPGFSSGAPHAAPLSNANYAAAIAASASRAVNTRSDVAAVELARTHAGMPQPLVFSVGGEVRHAAVRAGVKGKGGATGLGAENSMSLSAHTAAAAALKAKSSSVVGGSR